MVGGFGKLPYATSTNRDLYKHPFYQSAQTAVGLLLVVARSDDTSAGVNALGLRAEGAEVVCSGESGEAHAADINNAFICLVRPLGIGALCY